MAVVISILPPAVDNKRTKKAIASVIDQFSRVNEIIFVSHKSYSAKDYTSFRLGKKNKIIEYKSLNNKKLDKNSIYIFQKNDLSDSYEFLKEQRYYIQDSDGVLHTQNSWIQKSELPNYDKQIFGKFGERMGRGLRYFPYGFFTQNPGLGKQDTFGHRNETEIETLIDRKKTHKVVAVFGGSAAYGHNAIRRETFPFILEKKLNTYSKKNGLALEFTIINLAQEAALIINQMISFLLFCHKLKPNFVISHDGWNDLSNGAINDTHLLCDHQIAYLSNTEDWAKKLQNVEWLEPENYKKFHIKNPKHKVIGAYLERKTNFKTLANAFGSQFISGFQPGYFHKGKLSESEEKNIEQEKLSKPEIQDLFDRRLPELSKAAYKHHQIIFHENSVPFPEIFCKLGANQTLFHDRVHMTPDGEKLIAESYFKHCKETFFKDD